MGPIDDRVDRIGRGLRRRWARAAATEGFVRLVVAGGIALVVGLWAVHLGAAGTAPWLVGAGLALVGAMSLAAGIWSQIEA